MGETIYMRPVKEVMTSNPVSLHAGGNVHEALNLMVENRISALPIVDRGNHCVGILTTTDLVDLTRDVDDDVYQIDEVDPTSRRWLIEKLVHTVGNEPVSSYMTENVSTIAQETPLAKASREMVRNRVHHLPVVNQRDELVGIISTMDILAEFADDAPT